MAAEGAVRARMPEDAWAISEETRATFRERRRLGLRRSADRALLHQQEWPLGRAFPRQWLFLREYAALLRPVAGRPFCGPNPYPYGGAFRPWQLEAGQDRS